MRGNLGETQRNIVYPTHDNRAYDGPVGERNTARNYNPIVVGAKRANGRTYFSVRTKTTNHLTTLAKKSMAAMGATCSMYAAMRKDPAVAAKMDDVFEFMRPYLPAGVTERSYFMERIKIALSDKNTLIDLSAGSIDFRVENPWTYEFEPEESFEVIVKTDILVKFWSELAINPVVFKVDNYTGVGHVGNTFHDVMSSIYNTIPLSFDTITVGETVINGGVYVVSAEEETDVLVLSKNGVIVTLDDVIENISYDVVAGTIEGGG